MEINKLMKAIIYVRVSSEEQIENFSLSTQEKACRDFCEKEGIEVVKVFREEGERGGIAERTQLKEIFKFCAQNKGKIDILLVNNIDRFARGVPIHNELKAALMHYGVVLRSASQKIDETATGKLTENLFAMLAQFDNDLRGERSKAGLKERVNQGHWAWGAPMGYLNSEEGLVIDKTRAPLIKRAFEVYAQGNTTVKDLANKLNRWGLKTKRDKKILPQTVVKILDNKLYIGIIQVKEWAYEGVGLHTPLIEENLFYKVQAIRQGRSVTAVPRLVKNPDFPLKNVTYCKDCGEYLTGSWSKGRSKKYAYYHCTSCNKTRLSKNDLEYFFISALKKIQPNDKLKALFKQVLIDVWKQKQSEAITTLSRIDKELFNLKDLKKKLIHKNIDGVISDQDYKEQVGELNSKITLKEIDRSEYRVEETNLDYLISLSENLLSNVSLLWFEAPFEYKLRFQNLLFPKGVYLDNENIGTTSLGLPFSLIEDSNTTKTTLAPPVVDYSYYFQAQKALLVF